MKILKSIGIFLLVLMLCSGMMLLGGLTCAGLPNAALWMYICAIAMVILLVGGGLLSLLWLKKIQKMKVRDIMDLRDDLIARMAENRAAETRKFYMAQILSFAYVIVLVVLALALFFFMGAAAEGVYLCVLPVFVLYGVGIRVIREPAYPDFSKALPEKDFPLLYQTVRDVAGDLARGKQIHIFLMDSGSDNAANMGISQAGKHIWLTAGSILLGILSQEEMRQLLLHEFAHIRNQDGRELERYHRLQEFFNGDDSSYDLATGFAFLCPVAYLTYVGSLYLLLSSEKKEKAADQYVQDQGDTSIYIGQLAKTSAYELYKYEHYAYEAFFAPETYTRHYNEERLMAYREALVQREGAWRQILEHSLPAKVDTHPTFRQRWEAMDCCAYCMTLSDLQTPYGAECLAAIAIVDQRRTEYFAEHYEQLRQAHYLPYAKIIADYETSDQELSADALRPVLDAYYECGMLDKTEALCDRIIASTDSVYASAHARFWKGLLMLHRYDKDGLAYVYDAINANRNYIDSGLEEIGIFCTMMGLEQELEEFRAKAPELAQLKMDWTSNGITEKANLSTEHLPEGWCDQIVAHILCGDEDAVSHIYLVHEDAGNCAYSAFVLRYVEGISPERQSAIYEKTFRLLDGWPEDWDFYLYDYEPAMEKVLNKVPDSCVYPKNAP